MRRFLNRVMIVCAIVNLAIFSIIILAGWHIYSPDYAWSYLDMRINRFPYLLFELATVLAILRWLFVGKTRSEQRNSDDINWPRGSPGLATSVTGATAASFSMFDSDLASHEAIFADEDDSSTGVLSEPDASSSDLELNSINPANGLPMSGSVDIEGNAYGTDSSTDSFSSDLMSIDDCTMDFDDCTSGFDDCSSGIDDDWL